MEVQENLSGNVLSQAAMLAGGTISQYNFSARPAVRLSHDSKYKAVVLEMSFSKLKIIINTGK